MELENTAFLQDMFLRTQNICSWNITPDIQLVKSNCPEQDFFYNLFLVSSCSTAIQAHFALSASPLLVSDRIGLVWITARGADTIFMLGPVFNSELTEKHLYQLCQKISLSHERIAELWRFVKTIPTLSSHTAACYASMLHYGATNIPVKVEDVVVQTERMDLDNDALWGSPHWHGTWIAEQRLFNSIREGRYEDLSKLTTGNVGNMSGGDPLRQVKNVFIVFAVLCSRASILGGVSSEGALNLSDSFIQASERSETIQEVTHLIKEMHETFVRRVQKAKASSDCTFLVQTCMDYVSIHIFEKISIPAMAQEIGYNEQYISRKFKSETGESLVAYIHSQKIEQAKFFLKDSKLSVAEISDRLAFSSPSYFSAVFKKQIGLSPAEYQQSRHG